MIIGSEGTLYSPSEIFGLANEAAAPAGAEAAATSVAGSAAQSLKTNALGMLEGFSLVDDGKDTSSASRPSPQPQDDNDCVVCLTEQKEVLLLPCRYVRPLTT
jgi:hypothetical protein